MLNKYYRREKGQTVRLRGGNIPVTFPYLRCQELKTCQGEGPPSIDSVTCRCHQARGVWLRQQHSLNKLIWIQSRFPEGSALLPLEPTNSSALSPQIPAFGDRCEERGWALLSEPKAGHGDFYYLEAASYITWNKFLNHPWVKGGASDNRIVVLLLPSCVNLNMSLDLSESWLLIWQMGVVARME